MPPIAVVSVPFNVGTHDDGKGKNPVAPIDFATLADSLDAIATDLEAQAVMNEAVAANLRDSATVAKAEAGRIRRAFGL